MMIKLQYENLIIRQAVKADARQLALWWNDGSIMAHAGFPKGLGLTEDQVQGKIFEGLLIIEENCIPIGEMYRPHFSRIVFKTNNSFSFKVPFKVPWFSKYQM